MISKVLSLVVHIRFCGISWKPLIASYIITIEHPEKNRLDQIQNDRLSAFIYFHMLNIF